MVTPDTIIRTRRRSLSISVSKTGEVVVRAPKKLGLNYILSFLNQKEAWILNKKKMVENSITKNKDIINRDAYLFLGKQLFRAEVNKLKSIEVVNSNILFPSNCDALKADKLVYKWFLKQTTDILTKRLEYFSTLMQINYESFKVENCKSRWACCDRHSNLKFNFRISMLPAKLIDYIIIHELSHILEFNHSKMFYKVVESVLPQWKTHKKILKEYDFLLKLY